MISRRKVIIGGGAVAVAGIGAAVVGASRSNAMQEYDAAVNTMRAALSVAPAARDLVRYATLAANGHNTQPWRFRVQPRLITILPDLARRTPAVDPDDHHLFVSLGCAAENLSVASRARGMPGEVMFTQAGDGAVEFASGTGASGDGRLCDAIPIRQSTRAEFSGAAVGVADLRTLAAAARHTDVDVVLVTDRGAVGRIRDLVVAGNTRQMADVAFMRELKQWLRFNPHAALAMADGLFSATSGSPVLPDWLGPRLFDWAFTADAENARYVRQIDTSSGLAVFFAKAATHEQWVSVGRSCQRFALQATAMGLKHSFVNQPVEVASLRSALAAEAGVPGRRPDLVMRFGYGPTLPYSARRAPDAVMVV